MWEEREWGSTVGSQQCRCARASRWHTRVGALPAACGVPGVRAMFARGPFHPIGRWAGGVLSLVGRRSWEPRLKPLSGPSGLLGAAAPRSRRPLFCVRPQERPKHDHRAEHEDAACRDWYLRRAPWLALCQRGRCVQDRLSWCGLLGSVHGARRLRLHRGSRPRCGPRNPRNGQSEFGHDHRDHGNA